jgi:hypothetical protein
LTVQVHVRFAWFLPALIDKTRLLLAANDWEQMLEHAGRVLQASNSNVQELSLRGGVETLCLRFAFALPSRGGRIA